MSRFPDNIVGVSCRNTEAVRLQARVTIMLTIQLAQPSDWPSIQSGLACTHLDEGVVTSDVDATSLVARVDGRFAGFCMVVLCADVGILPALFVEPRFRGRRIAEHLIEKCVAHATTNGAQWVFTACPASGVPFMERIGFEVERRELVPVHVCHRLEAAGGDSLSLLSLRISRNTSSLTCSDTTRLRGPGVYGALPAPHSKSPPAQSLSQGERS